MLLKALFFISAVVLCSKIIVSLLIIVVYDINAYYFQNYCDIFCDISQSNFSSIIILIDWLLLWIFQVIDAISNAIKSTEGVSLLDVDPGPSTNRTVYTFVGSPDAVIEGALNAARVARDLIDMSKHKGMDITCRKTCAFCFLIRVV